MKQATSRTLIQLQCNSLPNQQYLPNNRCGQEPALCSGSGFCCLILGSFANPCCTLSMPTNHTKHHRMVSEFTYKFQRISRFYAITQKLIFFKAQNLYLLRWF